MASEQDWCLECGAAVTTRIAKPPGWRLPLLVGLAVLALLGVGVAIAVSASSDDADRAAGPAGARAPAAAATTPRTATKPGTRPTKTATGARTSTVHTVTVPGAREATGGGPVALWPAGQQGYTIVVPTGGGRPQAEREARRLSASGQRAGILKTDGYDFFTPGAWVVWAGRYPDRATAQARLAAVKAKAPNAYVTLVRPRGG
jgi:hypothetical protein